MSTEVAIINYGMGNICSVEKAFSKLGASFKYTSDHNEIKNAKRILLPGVGHFEKGIQELHTRNLVPLLTELAQKKPTLGICLGMQLLFSKSEEAPNDPGLGLVNGELKKFDISLHVPHVGWNNVYGNNKPAIFKDIENEANFYFVHSFHAILYEDLAHAKTDYEVEFVSAIEKGNLFGAQFHPEKSQKKGLKVLKNFLELNADA